MNDILKRLELDFEVKTFDIDAGGHLNNIVYIRWLEELRNSFWINILILQRRSRTDITLWLYQLISDINNH
ncbi:MAG: hypothetical protein IPJ75_15420 [Ignavibacteriales bacterium]|nr:hypothetical protein [Ignavibacteriales bacterium]